MTKKWMLDKLQEIESERQRLSLGGSAKDRERQRQRGRLLARERVQKLVDPTTFQELELWAKAVKTGFEIDETELPADSVAIGYGKIEGRTVLVYSHDFTVAGGTQASVQHSKVTWTMETAVKMGVPYIGILDSGGMRTQDQMGQGSWNTPTQGMGTASGSWMFSPSWASGVVPQISLMLGPNYAGSAYSPIQADFLFMREGTFMSLSSPAVIKEVTHAEVTQEEVGGARLHAEVSGLCDVLTQTEEETFEKCRKLLSFLPSNCREKPPVLPCGDDPDRRSEDLLDIVPNDPSGVYDVHQVIFKIVDNGDFFEIKPFYAKNMVVGFARLAGQTIGIIANNSMVKGGAIDSDCADKGARFIRFCDAFNIPLVFLVDTVGFVPDKEQERVGIERHAAKLPFAICEATVPRMTVYLRNCLGQGRIAMCSTQMGCDLAVAWPTARVGAMEAGRAVDTIYRKDLAASASAGDLREKLIKDFDQKYNNLFHDGARQLVQDIIDPRATRPVLTTALAWFAKKRGYGTELREENMPWRKHGNIPL